MMVLKYPKARVLSMLFCIISIATLLFSYNSCNPSSYSFKFAFRMSDNPVSKALCACSQCISMENEDPWFMERFNQSIPPLMSKKNSILSEDTYKWWQWIQSEKHPANYSDVVQRLFQVIPGEERYMDSGSDRCRTCAVVGNSGNLKGSNYGALIDSSDLIISTYLPVMAKIKANKRKVLIYNPTFFKYVYDSWLERHGRYPSTGFLALMFAIHICDEVNVYGFGADKGGNWHHYWENNRLGGAFRQTGVHDGDYEYNITLLLASKKKIKMFKGI